MRTYQNFAGINNVLEPEELGPRELTVASNVDVDQVGRIRRRSGFASASATSHMNVWQADGFVLATRGAAGDLVNVTSNTVLVAALGNTPRVWYCNLPDGRTVYTNGTTQGIVSATAATAWGVPLPTSHGTAVNTNGVLFAGTYLWALTHVRLADGLEGGPTYCTSGVTVTNGGVSFSGIPVRAGYSTNVYLSSHFGGERYLAGNTTTSTFSYAGHNRTLQLPCRTDFMQPPLAGKLPTFWRGRMLIAVGSVLFASRPNGWELFDLRRDYKMFSAAITLVQPVEDGIYVGTEKELVFLEGTSFDSLKMRVVLTGKVVLGSGVAVDGEQLRFGDGQSKDGVGSGAAMVCIADRVIVSGFRSGQVVRVTEDRYATDVQEVAATFRLVDGIPQYIALDLTA